MAGQLANQIANLGAANDRGVLEVRRWRERKPRDGPLVSSEVARGFVGLLAQPLGR
jgi:hypothetical protein